MTADQMIITLAAWLLLAVAITWLALDVRHHRQRLDSHKRRLDGHARAINTHTNALAAQMPTSDRQPMLGITTTAPRPPEQQGGAANGAHSAATYGTPVYFPDGSMGQARSWQDGDTVRIPGRPPSLTDIELTLARAGRPLTRPELAIALGCGTGDLLADLRQLHHAGAVQLASSHTAAQPAYTLTERPQI